MTTICKLSKYLIIASILFLFSCDNEGNDPEEIIPTTIQADNNWVEDEIIVNQEIWYRVVAEETYTTLFVEWAEEDAHGEDKNYTADIQVSAYMLNGTPYFEDKNNGYSDQIKTIDLGVEKEVLLKVTLTDEEQAGSFAIRSTGTGAVDVEYINLNIGDTWTEGVIADDEIVGYLVDCEDATQLKIIWAEFDSPETGYTADVMGSVFYVDGITTYQDVEKGKEFLNKNKSHSDDPKIIAVDASEGEIKIHISTNTLPGTYAIKVIE